ncbi:MAG: rhodanese-like domain-containing protein [Anaerolineae bacterium]|nr:rhodanese-like domain-containing protein [Anaerolineae bacterium]
MSSHKRRTHKSKSKRTNSSRPPRWWLGLGLVVIVAAVGFVVFRQIANSANPPRTILTDTDSSPLEVSPAVVLAKRDSGAFILDVRAESEWNEFHIPGSTLIPVDTLASRTQELPRDKEIVVVCRSGNRSAKGRDILRNAGFTRVTSMAGGLTEWKALGYPTVSGQS